MSAVPSSTTDDPAPTKEELVALLREALVGSQDAK